MSINQIENGSKIIRYEHDKNFTQIFNDCINDRNLCEGSLAVLVYIYSKPPNWVVRPKDLMNRFSFGKDKAYKLLKNLIEFGYARRYQQRKEDGDFGDWVTQVCDKPIYLSAPLSENKEAVDLALPDLALPILTEPSNQEHSNTKTLQRQIYKKTENTHVAPARVFELENEDIEENKLKAVQAQGSFEMFWGMYPYRECSKQKARDSWKVAIKKTTPEVIYLALQAQIESKAKKSFLGVFVERWPHASTWLNQARWEAEIEQIEVSASSVPKTYAEKDLARKSEMAKGAFGIDLSSFKKGK